MTDNHGRYIWYELLTPDPDAAKRFYGDVVGWTFEDMAGGETAYSVAMADGAGVAGLMRIPAEAEAMNVPPNWSGYVCVDDCDAAAATVQDQGGRVVRPPADIPEIGRFAVVADPHGAMFEIMTPRPMDPPRSRAPQGSLGHVGWHELYAGDLAADFGFYETLFGWRKERAVDLGPMGTYQIFATPDGAVGGAMQKPPQVGRPGWLYYFQVGSIEDAARRVALGGGRVINGPMEVPGGEWTLQGVDPQGAMFALVGQR